MTVRLASAQELMSKGKKGLTPNPPPQNSDSSTFPSSFPVSTDRLSRAELFLFSLVCPDSHLYCWYWKHKHEYEMDDDGLNTEEL